MNWDKKVVSFQHERGINAMQLGPAEAIAANRQARIIARWQRGQLRAPEAIERVARALNGAGWVCMGCEYEPYDFDECESCRDVCLKQARAAITALIGED